jgi:hypothetical protein
VTEQRSVFPQWHKQGRAKAADSSYGLRYWMTDLAQIRDLNKTRAVEQRPGDRVLQSMEPML